jgi:peptidyl-prolyl cis-trans isomerase D
MFESIRKHSKIVMVVLFLLIIPSFVLFGIDGYNRAMEKGTAVAKVDGQSINQGDWDAAHKMEVDRMRAQMPNLDAKIFESPQARFATLERLVRDRVLSAAANSMHLTTSDQKLARALQDDPNIAALRRPDGSLDVERYRQLLAMQNMTPEMFEARARSEISTRQVLGGLSSSVLAAPAQAAVSLDAFFERREIQVAQFKATDFMSRVNPGDADLQAYFQAHAAEFQVPEKANVEYLQFDLDSVKNSITINEDDLRTYYKQNAERLATKEERRASHILIASAKDAPEAERQKAKSTAQALLAELRKSPGSFAELAKKNSQDPGSAPKGGDLDFFARGAMVKPFEEAAFALTKGDISDVVESDFGFHIIKLTDIKVPQQKSFEELRPSLEAELKGQQAQRKFAELAETFTNMVYEQSDSLKPAGDKLKLHIQYAKDISRKVQAGSPPVLSNTKVLEALFSGDSIGKKRNTEAIEIAPNQLVSARIVEYTPARPQTLEEVKAKVRERVVAERAAELARKEGVAKMQAWQANPGTAGLGASMVVSREASQNQPVSIVNAALGARSSGLPSFVGVDLGAQGYAVVRVIKIVPRDALAQATAEQQRDQYLQAWAGAEARAYSDFLAEKFKVQIKTPKPARTSEELALGGG